MSIILNVKLAAVVAELIRREGANAGAFVRGYYIEQCGDRLAHLAKTAYGGGAYGIWMRVEAIVVKPIAVGEHFKQNSVQRVASVPGSAQRARRVEAYPFIRRTERGAYGRKLLKT